MDARSSRPGYPAMPSPVATLERVFGGETPVHRPPGDAGRARRLERGVGRDVDVLSSLGRRCGRGADQRRVGQALEAVGRPLHHRPIVC